MADIIRIDESTYRIEDGMVRFFLLLGEKKALMIDSGMTTVDAEEICESITKLPIELLNTHADRDHVAGNEKFEWVYMSEKELENYRGNGSGREIKPVKEGDLIDLGGRVLEIIDLPGHTKGSIAILDVNKRVLISGDSIQDGNIFMFGEQRNLGKYVESLKELQRYAGRYDVIYPSHGTFPVKPSLTEKLIEGASEILMNEAEGKEVDMFGTPVCLVKFDYAGFLIDIKYLK